MSLSTFTSAPNSGTDVAFRADFSPLGTAIAAVGWIQTSDTGQINWTTVLAPTSTSTAVGYQIFRMNDVLQAPTPVFMKIEYGAGSSSSAYPCLWVTIGTATNGTGSLTGVVGTRVQVGGNTYSTTTDTCLVDGDSSRLVFCLWPVVSGAYALLYSVERTHDGTGADTGIGVMCVCSSTPTSFAQWLVLNGGTVLAPYTYLSTAIPPTGGGFYGADYALFPVRWFSPGETVPSKNLCACIAADIVSSTVVTVNTWYGGTASFYTTSLAPLTYGGAGKYLMRND